MKKIIRDKTSDILLIVSFTISFLILLYLIPLLDRLLFLQDKEDGYNELCYYSVETVQTQEGSISFADFQNFIDDLAAIETSNIYCYGNVEMVEGISFFSGKMLIRQNEDIIEDFADAKPNCAAVVIKHSLDEYVKDDVLYIKTLKFPVDGYYRENEITCPLYLNLEKLDETHRVFILQETYKYFVQIPLVICFAGERDISKACSEFENICTGYGMSSADITEEMKKDLSGNNDIYKQMNRYSLVLALVLAIINCMNVSYLRTKRRRKEYAVRKAFGYTAIRLYVENLKSMLILSVISGVISVLIYSLLYRVEEYMGVLEMTGMFSAAQIILILIGIFIVSIVSSIPVMQQVTDIEPAQAISDWQ